MIQRSRAPPYGSDINIFYIAQRNAIVNMQMDGPLKTESCVEEREMLPELRIAPIGKLAQAPRSGVLELNRQTKINCVKPNVLVPLEMDRPPTMDSSVD